VRCGRSSANRSTIHTSTFDVDVPCLTSVSNGETVAEMAEWRCDPDFGVTVGVTRDL
jgi:hypothetical protein